MITIKESVRYNNMDVIILSKNEVNTELIKELLFLKSKKELNDFFNDNPDLDYIKTEKDHIRGQVKFFDCKHNGDMYIITEKKLNKKELEILTWWLNGCQHELDIENTWNEWYEVNTGIAYRGGIGYCYSLHAKS